MEAGGPISGVIENCQFDNNTLVGSGPKGAAINAIASGEQIGYEMVVTLNNVKISNSNSTNTNQFDKG